MTSGNVKPVYKNNGSTFESDVVINGQTEVKTLTALAINATEISTQKISTFGGQPSEFGSIETTSISNSGNITTDALNARIINTTGNISTATNLNAGAVSASTMSTYGLNPSLFGDVRMKSISNRFITPQYINPVPAAGVTFVSYAGNEIGGQLLVTTGGSAPSAGAPIVTFIIDSTNGLGREAGRAVALISPMGSNSAALADNKKPYIQWLSLYSFRLMSNTSSLANNTTYIWGISILG